MVITELRELGAETILDGLLPLDVDRSDTSSARRLLLNETESQLLVQLAIDNRLAPILGAAVHQGRVQISKSASEVLTHAIEEFLASQVRVERAGLRVIDALSAAGIDVRVVKGMATAHLDYPNPSMRPFGDCDLLISSELVPVAQAAMAQFESGTLKTPPGNNWRVEHSLQFRLDGVEIDIHHRLLHQAAGHLADRFDLFGSPAEINIAGRSLKVLPGWLRMVQASSQNVLGGTTRLSSDLDVAILWESYDVAMERCQEVGLAWVLHEGVRRSQASLGWGAHVDPPSKMTLRDLSFKRAYSEGQPSVLRAFFLELAAAKPLVGAAIARSTLLPGAEYLDRRGRTATEQLARQARRLAKKSRRNEP